MRTSTITCLLVATFVLVLAGISNNNGGVEAKSIILNSNSVEEKNYKEADDIFGSLLNAFATSAEEEEMKLSRRGDDDDDDDDDGDNDDADEDGGDGDDGESDEDSTSDDKGTEEEAGDEDDHTGEEEEEQPAPTSGSPKIVEPLNWKASTPQTVMNIAKMIAPIYAYGMGELYSKDFPLAQTLKGIAEASIVDKIFASISLCFALAAIVALFMRLFAIASGISAV